MKALRAILVPLYPILVYAGLQKVSPRGIAITALGILAARLIAEPGARWRAYGRAALWPVLALGAVIAVAAISNQPLALLLAPALCSFALLLTFVRSLFSSESVVEALARAQLGSLTEDDSRYCRRVTLVWSAFFLVNGGIALALALLGTTRAWALYTGFYAYLGVGLLFSAEYAYRQWRFRRYLGAPTDVLFRRLFPPRAE